TITIVGANDGPVAQNDRISVSEDTTYTSTIDLDANDSDIDNDNLSVIAGTFTTNQGGIIIVAADGSYTYTPPLDFNGLDSFTYTVTDGSETDTATLFINVGAENDAPNLIADTNTVNEDATLLTTATNGVLANDTDLDGDTISVTAIHAGISGTNTTVSAGSPGVITNEYGTLTINADGSYSFVANGASAQALANGVSANIVFTYTASDGTESETQTLTITIVGANDP
ncbi:tandem-95 repeat protein, partial [Shewanella intestini]